MKTPLPRILPRPRINELLDHIFTYPLTLIQAPIGFGKSTAFREYLRHRKLTAIQLSLMGTGGSLAYFWERITSRVSKCNPKLGSQLVGLGLPEDAPQAAKIVDLLNDCALEEPVLLVIEDYHLIDCPQIADLITLLAGESIPNFHIVLLARAAPCLPVAELIQKGLCWAITQEDLRFLPDEVQSYFRLMNAPVSAQEALRVANWTGGWISGIYLIARGRQQGPSGLLTGDIDQLLEVNLYSTYDSRTRAFLEKLSFLDAFTPEQLAFVLDDASVAPFLFSLVQGNAFLYYDRSANVYKMTDLLRDFLRKKAVLSGFDPTEMYLRMGRWFLERNKRVLAYEYLYRAGDVETILEALNREDYVDVHFAQFPQIHRIFEGLPEDVFFRYPLAALHHIRVKALTIPRTEHPKLHSRLSQMEKHFKNADLPEEWHTRILGEIHNTWLLVSFNDAEAMVAHAAEAVRYFNGRFSCLISNETEFTFGAANLLYCYYTVPGKLRETVEFISKNFPILGQAVEGCGSGSDSLILAEYALECGDLDSVSQHAYRAIYQSRLYHQVGIELCATFTLCRLAAAQGRGAEADRLLSQLSGVVEAENNSVFNTTLALCFAYIDCYLGRLDRVPRWLRENDAGYGSFMFRGIGFHHVVTGLTALLEKRFLQLEVFCVPFEQDWRLYNTQLGLIHGGIFRAASAAALSGPDAGARELCAALDIASRDGVVLPFAEASSSVLPLLSHPLIRARYPEEYINRVTSFCKRYLVSRASGGSEQIRLTERENEILHLLAEGKRHEEIASSLYISVPTVRYHTKNIYQKLGVNNKVSVLSKARELGLLQ